MAELKEQAARENIEQPEEYIPETDSDSSHLGRKLE